MMKPSSIVKSKQPMRIAAAVAACLLWPVFVLADTTYFVDPEWTGAKTGAAGTPWNSLTTAAWASIDSALTVGNVTVYFSAREAGADVNEATTIALAVNRTNTSAYRLTLDGNSKYNVNDTAPSWAAYNGTSRFQITAAIPVSTGSTARSAITVKGFRLIATGGQIVFWYGGNDVTIEGNEASSSATNTNGPGLYFGYTQYEWWEGGTTCPTARTVESCVGYTGLTIRGNYIHDTFGEGIYIGGCGDNDGCMGHTRVLIENNTVGPNIAVFGGEADAIDLKDGLSGVVVRGNTIDFGGATNASDGVVSLSGATIEQNYITGAGHSGIELSTYWNNSGPGTRDGTIIRNNILTNIGMNPSLGGEHHGIRTENDKGQKYAGMAACPRCGAKGTDGADDRFTNLKIYSNTIYRIIPGTANAANGISTDGTGTTVQNNIVSDVQGSTAYALLAPSGSLAGHSNNLFYQPMAGAVLVKYGSLSYTAGTLGEFEFSALSVDPAFFSTSAPYSPEMFRLRSTSGALRKGIPVLTFSDDYFRTIRGDTWDLGAVESSNTLPHAPTDVRIFR